MASFTIIYSMKAVLGILKRDLLALLKNPIALLVVGALLVLPGLYAWYCIIANWDPYSNTGAMGVALVNEDMGAVNDLAGEVNIGKQVTEAVQNNDKLDWRVYDSREEAFRDTRYSIFDGGHAVYATIVLPEDLSKNVVGIFEGSKDTPTIEYYPNEKYNAVATKVTDSAAQQLVRQINTGFSSTVNKKIIEAARRVSDDIEKKAGQANQSVIAEAREMQEDLDKVIASLDDAQSSIESWKTAVSGADTALAATADQLPAIRGMLDNGGAQINDLRAKTGNFESGLSKTIFDTAGTVSNLSGQASTHIARATQDLKTVRTDLAALEKAAKGNEDLELAIAALNGVSGAIGGLLENVDGRMSKINDEVQRETSKVTGVTTRISNEVMPQLDSGAYRLAVSLSKLGGAVGQFEPQVAQLRAVLSKTDGALDEATAAIADAKTLLTTISANLKSTAADIGAIGKAVDVDQLSKLINADPDRVGTFISSPVHMVTEEIFPVSNYGTGVAPFYTNLALWIGCFILVSLMKVEVRGFPEATPRQRYFGRLSLFIILALLQSQVICGVDILLGIDCANPGLFMLAGALCSFAYMNLIYALVKTFRNIGKTLCIFLLIMQVPGSSGMYPIQMMPGFFQFIHPALPFTYGIDAMRESLSGLYGLAYVSDLVMLLLIVPGSLLVGLGLRRVMANVLLLFDEEMNKVGFFASEEYEAGAEAEGMRSMLRALRAHDAYADDIEERAWRFNRVYPRLRKVGTVSVFAIPLVVLVLMLPVNVTFNLSPDTKLAALIIMLIVLFIVQMALIVLEYTHRSIEEETRLLGSDLLDGFDLDVLGGGDKDDLLASDDASPAGVVVPATEALQAEKQKGNPASDIFSTDVKLGFQSVVGVVVIVLLVITPPMYAWFNIAGSWDPYGATGSLKVAVANEDDGYKGELIPVTINVGDTVMGQLRGNKNFDWVFVGKDEAVKGVESSEYYAAIVIPENFSSSLMTYITDNADYPDVVYYTNKKENPIAPIITQKGADAIQENIRSGFTESVDLVALSVAYDVLRYVSDPAMSSYVVKMSAHLDDAIHDAKTGARELRTLGTLAGTVSDVVDTTGTAIEGIKGAGESAKGAIADAEAGASQAMSAFDDATVIARDTFDERGIDIASIQSKLDTVLDLLAEGSGSVPDLIQGAIDDLKQYKKDHPSVKPAAFDAAIDSLKKAKVHAEGVSGRIADAREKIDVLVRNAKAEVGEAKTFFNDTVAPSVSELRSTMGGISSSTSDVVRGLEGALGGIGDSTSGLSSQLSGLSGGLARSGDKLESAAANLEDMKTRVADALKSGNLQQISSVILGGDVEAMAASLAVPVQTERMPLFSVANYGSAMAPFYTVLSLWVGALVMISTMRVHVVEERIEELKARYVKVRPRHEFFGRYGIFGLIGLMQSSLVLLGDLFLLHIECANPVMFFIFGLFIGQIFCLIVFTITELFGDVGKALCVILLIMQVAASGGTFPVEMLHPILYDVSGFLPFFYAMIMLQECVAGVTWTIALGSAAILLVMAAALLVIALPLRRPFRKLNDFFEAQLEKTGYM